MVMSLVASLRAVSLIPAYLQALMPWPVVSRPLAGDAPRIDLVVGYSRTNSSPVPRLFLSRVSDLIGRVSAAP
jgi:LysR family hca operon transcriptional activator